MLNHLKKFFVSEPSDTQSSANVDTTAGVEMATETSEQPEMAVNNNMAELVAQLASQVSAFSTLETAFAELSSKYETAVASLSAYHEEKQQLVAQALAAKLQARKESLELAVGTEKAATLLSTLEVLDDAGFAAVVSSMSMNLEKEANTTSFKEVGVSASADATKVVEETALEAALKQKYNAK